jgi:hypothetical protein
MLPAAFLAQRGRMWGLGLPLLAWLPNELLPLLAIAATLVPFVVRRPGEASPWARPRLTGPTPAAATQS